MYPTSLGGEHMRSMVPLPEGTAMYPQLLRQAGYYCTNNSKTDYNLAEPGKVWDESSGKAHWKNRKPGQPFFAVFNSTKSHESQIRTRPHKQVHDPAKVRIPAYHPDTPETRQDWAQYYDGVSAADADAGKHLDEIAAAGLADDTIIFYFADHGSGMPRSKRWPCNSGLQVPLVVYIPDKFKDLRPPDYQAGGKSDRLVSFVDFAPTVLSLAGIEPPDWMQGHAFLGRFQEPPQPYLFGFRGRMDERTDLVRSATDGRFVYVRNYMPHKIYGQHVEYMFETPTTRVWKALHDAGKLTPAQDVFWNTKPPEELYDLMPTPTKCTTSPPCPNTRRPSRSSARRSGRWPPVSATSASCPKERSIAVRAVPRLTTWATTRAGTRSSAFFATAELASMLRPDAVPALKAAARDDDAAVRCWAALGFLMRGRDGVRAGARRASAALDDASPHVRIAAAEALGRHGNGDEYREALASWPHAPTGAKTTSSSPWRRSTPSMRSAKKPRRFGRSFEPYRPTAWHQARDTPRTCRCF